MGKKAERLVRVDAFEIPGDGVLIIAKLLICSHESSGISFSDRASMPSRIGYGNGKPVRMKKSGKMLVSSLVFMNTVNHLHNPSGIIMRIESATQPEAVDGRAQYDIDHISSSLFFFHRRVASSAETASFLVVDFSLSMITACGSRNTSAAAEVIFNPSQFFLHDGPLTNEVIPSDERKALTHFDFLSAGWSLALRKFRIAHLPHDLCHGEFFAV